MIGAGNVAWHLSKAFENAGHGIAEVYSRNRQHANSLTERLYDATPVNHLNLSKSSAELFLLTIPDDAYREVVQHLILPENAILAHTSGSHSLSILQGPTHLQGNFRTGVFYPLQSFNKGVPVEVEEIPLCIEASDRATEVALTNIARDISQTVYLVTSEERRVLHIAAVLASNFTNHLWALTKDLVDKNALEFDLLKPLIRETLRKALDAPHPALVQTGPAIRKDQEVIRNHLSYLQSDPRVHKVYEILSESICQGKNKK